MQPHRDKGLDEGEETALRSALVWRAEGRAAVTRSALGLSSLSFPTLQWLP